MCDGADGVRCRGEAVTPRTGLVGADAYPAWVADDLHLFHITCGGCAADWAGDDRAHCGSCHLTFDSIALFDAHRTGERCTRPRALGLVPTKNGIWREPLTGRRRTG
jgi:hypothetical protein